MGHYNYIVLLLEIKPSIIQLGLKLFLKISKPPSKLKGCYGILSLIVQYIILKSECLFPMKVYLFLIYGWKIVLKTKNRGWLPTHTSMFAKDIKL